MSHEHICFSSQHHYAVFNTGLVDKRYEPIYALFKKNTHKDKPQEWFLIAFCVEGEDEGKTLVQQFEKMPNAAHYFNEVSDMLYDPKVGKPSLDKEHIILENVDRLPYELIVRNSPKDFNVVKPDSLTLEERKKYYNDLREAYKNDMAAYRSINNRLEDALTLAIKRVQWNYKSAVPMYYPRRKMMCLMLPLCLVDDGKVDVALVVSKTKSGRYQGETIYLLDCAYKCARLVCRPDSDWLMADKIADIHSEEEENFD